VVVNKNVEKNQAILNKLWSQGVIDAEGNVLVPKKPVTKMTD
jgi:hypothetical protein